MSNQRKLPRPRPRPHVVPLCKNCGPKPIGAQYGDVRVGNCVKRMFVSPSGIEHMWVHVDCVHPDAVRGHLHSHPVHDDYDPPLDWGTAITVDYDLIEDIEQCEAAAA